MYLIPSTKVEEISGLEHMWRTMLFPTEVGGFKADFWKLKTTKALLCAVSNVFYVAALLPLQMNPDQ